MVGTLARGAYVLFVAGMIVVWAISAGQGSPVGPQKNHVVAIWWC